MENNNLSSYGTNYSNGLAIWTLKVVWFFSKSVFRFISITLCHLPRPLITTNICCFQFIVGSSHSIVVHVKWNAQINNKNGVGLPVHPVSRLKRAWFGMHWCYFHLIFCCASISIRFRFQFHVQTRISKFLNARHNVAFDRCFRRQIYFVAVVTFVCMYVEEFFFF